MRLSGTRMRRRAPRWAIGLLCGALALATGAGLAQPPAAHAASGTTISLRATITDAAPGDDIPVVATVTAGDSGLAASTLTVRIRSAIVDSSAEAKQWLGGEIASWQWGGSRVADRIDFDALGAGQSETFDLTIPAQSLSALGTTSVAGFIPISASIDTADAAVAWSLVPWQLTNAVGTTQVLVPITAPAGTGEYISEDALVQWTGPGGPLRRQLEALRGLDVALAVDPRIVDSIEQTSDSSPARDWLTEVAGFATVVPLTYADADVAALAAAGVPRLPRIDTDDSIWTANGIAFPSGDGLTDAALRLYAASGYTSVVVPSTRLSTYDGTLRDMSVLVSDQALADAISGATNHEGLELALATRALTTNASSPALVALDRDWTTQLDATRAALEALADAPWAGIDALIAPASGSTELSLKSQGSSPLDPATLRHLFSATGPALRFATLTGDQRPVLTQQINREFLALASRSWESDLDNWTVEVDAQISTLAAYVEYVRVADASPITLISGQSEIPISLANSSDHAIDVGVTLTPSTGRIVVTNSRDTIHIDPHSTGTIRVPVRALANGAVSIDVQPINASGRNIGQPTTRDMTVNAEWESWGVTVTVILVVVLFGFGIVRGVRRTLAKRRDKTT